MTADTIKTAYDALEHCIQEIEANLVTHPRTQHWTYDDIQKYPVVRRGKEALEALECFPVPSKSSRNIYKVSKNFNGRFIVHDGVEPIHTWDEENDAVEHAARLNREGKKPGIPVLVQRCLAHGVVIYPFMLQSVLDQYNLKQVPDDVLSKASKDFLEKYVYGLHMCGQESAKYWTEGFKVLKELGFEERERRTKLRSFVSLVWVGHK